MNGYFNGSPVISFEKVSLGFEEGDILQNVSFSVAARETRVLVGETGTGKTLTLKLAAGLLRPDSGHVRVLGEDVTQMPEAALLQFRRNIGFVFQEGALFDSLTVADNVAYRLREDRVDEEEVEIKVREALRFVEMEEALDLLPSELSGGMRRRVAIARALVTRPPIVLYDSPTAGLDPVTAQTIIALILHLRDIYGVTSLLATHRLQDAFALANYCFDPVENRVLALGGNGARSGQLAVTRQPDAPQTSIMVYREGQVYFQGDQRAFLYSEDVYLRRFLVEPTN
jgi:phospholipid/cholesterol/gamma-HCH transport system ATP-binding protein